MWPGERLAHPLGRHRPAAERQHRPWRRGEQLADERLLARPERGLALRGEHVLDPAARALLEDQVGVDRAGAERRRRRAGGRRLARPHEADEDERAPAYDRRRFHPIRSS